MENQLPSILEFTGSEVTEGDFKVSLNKLLLYLNELLGTDGQKLNLIPSGIISMWSGAANAIPAGWALCNGENGTPDLRDKFVVGAGKNYAVGATGGATSTLISGNTGETTLTVSQMPVHAHNITGGFSAPERTTGAAANGEVRGPNVIISQGAGGGGTHSHSINKDVPTVPPYYALCLIMKL